jgi:SAM-dependent methyltransferase
VDVFFTEEEWRACLAHLEGEALALQQYRRARREAPLNVLYYDTWVRRMLRLVPAHCQDHLVELMCGEAEICRRLPAACRSALALDTNVRMVEAAADDLHAAGENRVRVVCGTAARLPIASASVGAVLIQGGLHHARPFLGAILKEIARVLRPDGILVASEPANDNFLIRAIRRWQYSRSALQGHDPDEDGFTRRELDRALADCGIRLTSYQVFGYLAYPLLGNTDLLPLLAKVRRRGLGHALLAVDWVLERLPLVRRLGWASIFTAVPASGGR